MNRLKTDLDKIKTSDELKEKTLTYVMSHKEKKRPVVPMVAALAMIVFLVIYIVMPSQTEPPIVTKEVYSYVSIDINPSIELRLDQKDTIIEVISYNQEADQIIKETDLEGKTIQDSLLTLMDNETLNTYLKEGYMQVSIYGENADHSNDLEKEIDTMLSQKLSTDQYGCKHYLEADLEKSQSHHMSFGKYQIIEEIVKTDSSYTIDELQGYTMKELKTLYEKVTGETLSDHDQHGYEHGHSKKQNRHNKANH